MLACAAAISYTTAMPLIFTFGADNNINISRKHQNWAPNATSEILQQW